MKHSLPTSVLSRGPRSRSVIGSVGSLARGRKLGLAFLVMAVGGWAIAAASAVRAAENDPAAAVVAPATTALTASVAVAPEKAEFARLIEAQVRACSWTLEGRVYAGDTLAGKGLEVAVSEIKWDDEKVYFVVTIAPSADLQALLGVRKSWVFPLAWSYSRTAAAGVTGAAPVLKLTEAVGTFPVAVAVPTPSAASRATATDWRKYILSRRPPFFPRPF